MYILPLQISENAPVLLPKPFPQFPVLLPQFLILLLQLPYLLFQQLNPTSHGFVQDIPARVDGACLSLQCPADLSPHGGILIKEPSGKPGHFHQLRNRYPFSLLQHLPDCQLCRCDLLIAPLPVYFNHLVVFAHNPHPIPLNLPAGSWSALPWLCAFRLLGSGCSSSGNA
jgi:hypothetical protein